jgi:hypothetical protein
VDGQSTQAWEYTACAHRLSPIRDGIDPSWHGAPLRGGEQKMASGLPASLGRARLGGQHPLGM